MTEKRRRGEVTRRGAKRRLAASRRGSARVSEAFDGVLTRKQFAAAVGIHPTTLRRWEALGVVAPQPSAVIGIPTMVFQPEDIDFGRRLVAALREHPGELSLAQAAKLVRRDLGGGDPGGAS